MWGLATGGADAKGARACAAGSATQHTLTHTNTASGRRLCAADATRRCSLAPARRAARRALRVGVGASIAPATRVHTHVLRACNQCLRLISAPPLRVRCAASDQVRRLFRRLLRCVSSTPTPRQQHARRRALVLTRFLFPSPHPPFPPPLHLSPSLFRRRVDGHIQRPAVRRRGRQARRNTLMGTNPPHHRHKTHTHLRSFTHASDARALSLSVFSCSAV